MAIPSQSGPKKPLTEEEQAKQKGEKTDRKLAQLLKQQEASSKGDDAKKRDK